MHEARIKQFALLKSRGFVLSFNILPVQICTQQNIHIFIYLVVYLAGTMQNSITDALQTVSG